MNLSATTQVKQWRRKLHVLVEWHDNKKAHKYKEEYIEDISGGKKKMFTHYLNLGHKTKQHG
jgi:hypothetical protein